MQIVFINPVFYNTNFLQRDVGEILFILWQAECVASFSDTLLKAANAQNCSCAVTMFHIIPINVGQHRQWKMENATVSFSVCCKSCYMAFMLDRLYPCVFKVVDDSLNCLCHLMPQM